MGALIYELAGLFVKSKENIEAFIPFLAKHISNTNIKSKEQLTGI